MNSRKSRFTILNILPIGPVLKTEKRLSRDALENMGPDEINSRWDTVRKFLAGKRS
jgi:hypothetical protein